MASTNTRRRRRRSSTAATESPAEALARIQASDNPANYAAIVQAFAARGIPADQIKPRENVLTFRAWRAQGRHVRRGEHAAKIDVWIELPQIGDDGKPVTDGGKPVVRHVRRSVAVFHISQTDPNEPRSADESSGQPGAGNGAEGSPTGAGAASGAKPSSGGGSRTGGRRGVTAERLRELAEGMQSRIDAKLNPAIGRQNHTARRARIAASMREDGYRLQAIQRARLKMADAIDAGSLPDCLVGVFSEGEIAEILTEYANEDTDPRARQRNDEHRTAHQWLLGQITSAEEQAAREEWERHERLRCDLLANPPEGFFPTPASLARRMVELAKIGDGDEVLEPSAGSGAIAEAVVSWMAESGVRTELLLVEQDARLCEYLRSIGFEPHHADILTVRGQVNRVVMNPPYERKQDLRHVRHCFGMLAPGGRMVALIAAGFQFRADRETCEFREWLQRDAIVAHCEILENAFTGPESQRQTGVRVALLVIDKPHTAN